MNRTRPKNMNPDVTWRDVEQEQDYLNIRAKRTRWKQSRAGLTRHRWWTWWKTRKKNRKHKTWWCWYVAQILQLVLTCFILSHLWIESHLSRYNPLHVLPYCRSTCFCFKVPWCRRQKNRRRKKTITKTHKLAVKTKFQTFILSQKCCPIKHHSFPPLSAWNKPTQRGEMQTEGPIPEILPGRLKLKLLHKSKQ